MENYIKKLLSSGQKKMGKIVNPTDTFKLMLAEIRFQKEKCHHPLSLAVIQRWGQKAKKAKKVIGT